MDIIGLIKLAIKIAFYGVPVILVLGVISTAGSLISKKKAGLFLLSATIGLVITAMLESWLQGGTWWIIVTFSTVFCLVGSADDPNTGNRSDYEEGGLDDGDKFLLTLWIASLFERRDR